MTIYMIQGKEYDHIEGLWTDVDQMLDWISNQAHSWDERTGETELEVFMKENQLLEYQDGGCRGEYISWDEVIP